MRGRTVTLKVKFADFTLITRSRASPRRSPTWPRSTPPGRRCWRALFPVPKGIRLLGLGLHSLVEERRSDERRSSLDWRFDEFSCYKIAHEAAALLRAADSCRIIFDKALSRDRGVALGGDAVRIGSMPATIEKGAMNGGESP